MVPATLIFKAESQKASRHLRSPEHSLLKVGPLCEKALTPRPRVGGPRVGLLIGSPVDPPFSPQPGARLRSRSGEVSVPPPAPAAPAQSLERAKLSPQCPFSILDHSITTHAGKDGCFLLSFVVVGYIEIDH